MAVIGSVEAMADKDVKAGEKTTIPSLFSLSERCKEYELKGKILEGRDLKVSIAKFQPFETTADATLNEGENASCWRLVRFVDFSSRELVASEDVGKGDKLTITYESE